MILTRALAREGPVEGSEATRERRRVARHRSAIPHGGQWLFWMLRPSWRAAARRVLGGERDRDWLPDGVNEVANGYAPAVADTLTSS